MTDVRTATADLLEEKPALEDDIEAVLAVDAAQETWTFDDVPLDSGVFGELVSRGIVTNVEGEYTVADREAVHAAIESEASPTRGESSLPSVSLDRFASVSGSFDRRAAVALSGAVLLVVLFRIVPYPAVFRGSDVILSGNDPYAYRYVVHQLLAQSSNPLDFSVLSSLPFGMEKGEPLTVATLWWASAVFGGVSAAGGVLAWYPVVSAIVTALLVYVLTVRVTEDRRAGIAAVALLAVVPAHAFRTGLGFADHHAFDYPWLALTALSVVSLAGRGPRDRRTWGWVGALGVGVGAQTLAWDAGPLLLVPLGVYALVVVPSLLRADRSPVADGVPFVAGIGLGALLTIGAHVAFGWHTTAVVVAPVLLFGGTAGAFGLGALARRFEVGVRSVVGVEVVGVLVGSLLLRRVVPAFSAQLDRGIDFLLSTGGIAETTSLVSGDLGTIVGPILLFGFALFLAVPYFAWASWTGYRDGSPKWLATSAYGWYFLLLALIQIRFGGQLAIFTAVFAGFGLVHVAWWVDLASVPAPFDRDGAVSSPTSTDEAVSGAAELEWPERRNAMYTAALGLSVGSLGGLMTPIKHSQLTIDDSMYEAAKFMRAYSDERGWDSPENYVFSRWGRNRVYNWFVNGESSSYAFAQRNFREFAASTAGEEWYERLKDRVGFVVIGGGGSSTEKSPRTVREQLSSENFGVESAHYRAVWADETDSRRVFTLVPGGTITGPASPNATVTIDGEVDIGDRTESVAIESSTGEHGVYQERVPLPGTYRVGGDEVSVSERTVLRGAIQSAFDGDGYAHWSFDEGSGKWAYDRVGGHHGRVHGAEWTDRGRSRSALSFEGGASDYVEMPIDSLQEFTISLWASPTALDVSGENDYRDVIRAATGSLLIFEENGGISFRLPGADGGRLVAIEGVTPGTWNHVVVTFDGTERAMYVNDTEQARDEVSIDSLEWGGSLRVGNRYSTPSRHGYAGRLDEVRIFDDADY